MTMAAKLSFANNRTPGVLWGPFGWAAAELAPVVQADPELCARLLCIDRARMHLIAFAVAHADGPVTADYVSLIICKPFPEVVDCIFGYRPRGLTRVLARLPSCVLKQEYYRDFAKLLADAEAAKILHHSNEIDHTLIDLLRGVPIGLRRNVMTATMQPLWHRLARFTDSLALLVSRGVAPNLDTLIADLAAATQPGQFVAKLRGMVDALPLPAALPPPTIGKARRLDWTTDVRRLAKAWRNCLAMYADGIDDGQCAIYLRDDERMPAVCLVERVGRFGWVLDEVKGPRNANFTSETLGVIRQAFAAVGVPEASIVHPLRTLLEF